MGLRTKSLFHFTQKIETLKAILASQLFWPRYCLEDTSWILNDYHLAYPMVCFCDIPLSRIDDHANYYGKYAIGLSQEWGLLSEVNPLMYLHKGSSITEQLAQAMRDLCATETIEGDPENKKKIDAEVRRIIYLMAYLKPFRGTTWKNGSTITRTFYEESEWRYVPHGIFSNSGCYLRESDFQDTDSVEQHNKIALDKAPLKFSVNDIRYVFVQKQDEIPDLHDFIMKKLDGCSARDLKKLVSKIVSLEEIRADI